MEMSPIQGNFLAGEMQAELYPELLFYVHREEHVALYNFLQLGRKKENSEGSVGIVAINTCLVDPAVDGEMPDDTFQKLRKMLLIYSTCLSDIHQRACALQQAPFGLFSKMRGLNSWSKLKISLN